MRELDRLPELPTNWIWTKLKDIGTIYSGGTPSTADESNFSGGIPWITPADLSGFTGKYIYGGKRSLSEKGLSNSSAVLMPKGTVLFSSRAPIGYVAIAGCPMATNQGFKNIVPANGVLSEFVYYYLSASKKLAEEYASGTTFKEISATAFSELPFPLPPSSEQHRIVAKIEELFSRLDAGVEALNKAKNLLEQFRRSLFRDAFTGKLTEQLRTSMQYCPTNQVYYSIPQSNIENVELYDLPIGWRWVSLGDVGEISGGITKNRNRKRFDRIVPYLRVANVYANTLDLREIKTIGVTKEEFERALLKEGDLLVVEGNGSLDQIGRVALWDGSIPNCVHQNHLIKVRFYDKSLEKYVLYWLLSTQGRDFIIRAASSTSGLYTLSISKVASLPIPLCPAIEREKIVMEIERQTAVFDYIQKILIKQLTKAAQLKQSILSKAFEGSLVPQDPLDESASLLLKRIRSKQIK